MGGVEAGERGGGKVELVELGVGAEGAADQREAGFGERGLGKGGG